MAQVNDVVGTLINTNSQRRWDLGDPRAWSRSECPHCQATQQVVLAAEMDQIDGSVYGSQLWLLCPSCTSGSYKLDGVIYPTTKPLRSPDGVPPDESAVWEETRACLGVGAHTAAVMLCRKILFHIAVTHGLPAKNDRDRAPTFVEVVNHIEAQGLISVPMRRWVDPIKDVGNEANHELAPVSGDRAMAVATFTEELLTVVYEMPERLKAFAPPAAEDADAS